MIIYLNKRAYTDIFTSKSTVTPPPAPPSFIPVMQGLFESNLRTTVFYKGAHNVALFSLSFLIELRNACRVQIRSVRPDTVLHLAAPLDQDTDRSSFLLQIDPAYWLKTASSSTQLRQNLKLPIAMVCLT